ncbi:alpha/beta hydrolase [Lewinella sp. JB7]|uniref:alpha/beta hydrolase n=1 Tax=Lewinella sp. JB7 TaxID=2962887 RepID=UPI0020C96646|nr:alpha/beta fold hydrolase [Lewinella sp. JB7]MCP9235767.1 lysophospholipase [Lewinella sp. JB7]
MKWIKRIGIVLGLGYLLLCLVLYGFQERLIFRPNALPPDYAFEQGEESSLRTPDGVDLSILRFEQEAPAGVILYLHGNRGSNRRSLYQTRDLIDTDHDLYLFDYRGYGKSGGEISSETQLFADAQLVYDTLATRYGESNVILVGYSMGTGMATYLAANNHPRHCVLVAPYASITAMKNLWLWAVPDLILKYPLNNVDHAARANCPITILHGDRDGLIPYAMAEEIRDAAPDRVELIELEDTGHRGAILHPRFHRTMDRLLSK